MHNWEFLQNASGRWFWRHTHAVGPQTTSTRDFATRAECMADAIQGVYSASRISNRRLRDSDKQYPR
ncbi:MAG: hypothetical protein ACXWIS_16815 [Burkholderiales bacterium]